MSLPKVSQPTFKEIIPSTQKEIIFRPFLVQEEKILLIAQEGSTSDIIRAIKQVLTNCCTEDINIEELTTFDLEYLFLKLRAKSVNNIVKVSYEDHADGEVRDFEIDLDTIEVEFDPNNDKKIEIQDGIGIMMKFPSADITDKITEFTNEADMMMFFIVNSIDYIYDAENVYPAKEHTEEELVQFLEGLPVPAYEKIKNFFETMPKLYHKIEYTNNEGTLRKIEFNNLRDFFMWG